MNHLDHLYLDEVVSYLYKYSIHELINFFAIRNCNVIFPIKNNKNIIGLIGNVLLDIHWTYEMGSFYWLGDKVIPLKKVKCGIRMVDLLPVKNTNTNGYMTIVDNPMIISIYPPDSEQYIIMREIVHMSMNIMYTEGVCGLIVFSNNNTLVVKDTNDSILTSLYSLFDLPYNNWTTIKDQCTECIDRDMSYMPFSINTFSCIHYSQKYTYLVQVYNNHMYVKNIKGILNSGIALIDSVVDIRRIKNDINEIILGNMLIEEFTEFYFTKNFECDIDDLVYIPD